MGVSITSSSTQVSISGGITTSLPTASATQNIVNFVKYQQTLTSGTPIDCYTVTAGKTFYCTGFSMANGANTSFGGKVLSDGVQVGAVTLGGGAAGTWGGATLSGGILFTTAATKKVQIDGSFNGVVNFTCWGFEQ